ncbi:MAG: hypothetical protein Q8R83_09270 [Legionellaceae bacterium]|nr:hypothetical protein [Legionellaceae bacterium]
MGTKQDRILKIREILDQIKRYYTITQKSLDNHLSRRPAPLSQEKIHNCSCKLKSFIEIKQSFENCVKTTKTEYLQRQELKKRQLSEEAYKEIAEDVCVTMTEAASNLYHNLSALQRNLSYLSVQDQNKHNEEISRILDISARFELVLGELSDFIAEHEVISSAFSLARHMELLPILYQRSYETNYNRYSKYSFGIFYSFKVLCRSSARKEEIEFISKKLSKHSQCNDVVRIITAKVIIEKINDREFWYNSLLKQLLEKGIKCSGAWSSPYYSMFDELNEFCHSHRIFIHNDLQCYLNEKIQDSENHGLITTNVPHHIQL